jgi:hypothetical protein
MGFRIPQEPRNPQMEVKEKPATVSIAENVAAQAVATATSAKDVENLDMES